MEDHSQVVVVIVPFPLQGHLNQLLHLSHLITTHGLPVHYAGSASHNHQAKIRHHGWDPQSSQIHFHDLPLPLSSCPPPKPVPSSHCPAHIDPLFEATLHLRLPIHQLLLKLSTMYRRIVILHDGLMASVVQDAKKIHNAETYAFVPVPAFTYALKFIELLQNKPIFTHVHQSLPSHEDCFTPEAWKFIFYQEQFLGSESGRLYNTCKVFESNYIELLEKLSIDSESEMKHFAIGPLNPVEIKITTTNNNRHVCLEWLDKQEVGSVIYVSFGSLTSMTDEQTKELALGLEKSEQKFIWVLRRADTCDNFITDGEVIKPQLPEGYENRVKDRGMVIREWIPQVDLLAHPSIGGFMSHCGWNSCMESISMGVAMAAWPMHSDQPMNAVLVTEVLKIGVLVRDWTHRAKVVTSSFIENVVRRLMGSKEGEEMQKRAADLGVAVRGSTDKGGISRLEMDSFISHITRS